MQKKAVYFFLLPLLAIGQVTTSSLTVTASRTTTLQPDEAIILVNVAAPLTTSRDEVLASLQGTGVSAANFAGLSSLQTYNNDDPSRPQTVLYWSFLLYSPISDVKSVLAQLATHEGVVSQKNPALTMSFFIQGTQVSQSLAQKQTCVIADLIADARAKALTLAGPAQLTLGPVMAMSSASVNDAGSCSLTVKFAAYPL
jgi:hypothetical protein